MGVCGKGNCWLSVSVLATVPNVISDTLGNSSATLQAYIKNEANVEQSALNVNHDYFVLSSIYSSNKVCYAMFRGGCIISKIGTSQCM
jgi:hypothetical protein